MNDAKRELMDLEESLWRPQTRFDSAYMGSLLAEGFIEFGQSGRVHGRDATISAPAEDFSAELPLPDFAVRMVTNNVAVVTYRSEVHYGAEHLSANRSSIWRRGSAGWILEFHQGTPINA